MDELSELECHQLLRDADVGRLAVHLPDGGGVDIFPVNFVLHNETVLLRTGAGTKLHSLEHEPLVAFEADDFDRDEGTAWSVVIKGFASRVVEHDELFGLLNVNIDTAHPERKPYFVRVVPTATTGRRFTISRRVAPEGNAEPPALP